VAVPFAVTDIQERVRVRCDLPVFTANTKVTTAMILAMVQESARDLSGILDDAEWYFVTTAQLNTAAGIASISLPVNFAALQRLCWRKSSNEVLELNTANLNDVHPLESGLTWASCVPGYRLVGNTLEFFPTPDAVYALELRYSTGAFIASAADTLMGQVGWDTWIVYNCCCIVKQRSGEDYSAFAAERSRIEEKIQNKRRDRTGIVQPRNVRDCPDPNDRDYGWWRL
jgi:hypothetical protein